MYETLALQVARHPSESESYLIARVLAYALEFTEGIDFSKGGVSDPEEPAILVRDMTGAISVWIEVGLPDAARLHKASKASPRVIMARRMRAFLLANATKGQSGELRRAGPRGRAGDWRVMARVLGGRGRCSGEAMPQAGVQLTDR